MISHNNTTKTNMHIRIMKKYAGIGMAFLCLAAMYTGCTLPASLTVHTNENKNTPEEFKNATSDTVNTARIKWRDYFTDPNLIALIDSALGKNQELNIMRQEMTIAQNEIRALKGEYLPFVNLGAEAGVEKPADYTQMGALENELKIKNQDFPDPLQNYMLGLNASWELDIWKRLRNARKSAVMRYLGTVEGRNFMITNLVREIANSYYELMALDAQLEILLQNIEIQTNALEIVRMEKTAARVTELAVRKFEAEVLKNQSRIYYINQSIIETENHINFLVGRFPQPIARSSNFLGQIPSSINAGVPSQLLANRPDIRQAENNLEASKIDVKVARAQFYPMVRITAGLGFQAFKPQFLVNPESLMYGLAGELMAPLINRNALKAYYYSASAKQIQNVYDYERTVLNAYIEVTNQVSNIGNLASSYERKEKQVQALIQSIAISTRLFRNARADYMEVLMTQRDALEARFELVDTKMQQMHAMVNIYQQLGGGWN
jgi:NodT family efflux transporter outer membrane factor (OMF) lipoprotein